MDNLAQFANYFGELLPIVWAWVTAPFPFFGSFLGFVLMGFLFTLVGLLFKQLYGEINGGDD